MQQRARTRRRVTRFLSATTVVMLVACQTARKLGLQVSCDLNFRAKLWNWRGDVPKKQLAAETMAGVKSVENNLGQIPAWTT